MQPTLKWLSTAACAGLLALASASPASAQEEAPEFRHVLSANPLGFLFEYFNAEYEGLLSPTTTLGVSGTLITLFDEADYFSLEGKYRYYPQARAFEGFALGGTVGYAQVDESDVGGFDGDDGTASVFTLGIEIDYNWLVGRNGNFYIGTGIGAKRLFGGDVESETPVVLPTIRLVNVGFAF